MVLGISPLNLVGGLGLNGFGIYLMMSLMGGILMGGSLIVGILMVGILMVGSLRDHNLTAETSLADEVSAAKMGEVIARTTKAKRKNLIVEAWIE